MERTHCGGLHRIKQKGLFMFHITPRINFMKLISDNRPRAYASVQGEGEYSDVQGLVYLYEVPFGGILIEAEVFGLPDLPGEREPSFYGFHIHEFGDCSTGLQRTGGHYNPKNVKHPMHAGDLPPLPSSGGYAWLAYYNANLELYDIVGRSVIVHRNSDDFRSQPSGDAGEKMACGVITFVDGQEPQRK